MHFNPLALFMLVSSSLAVPLDADLSKRQSCPSVHVFGARGTTVPPGYGLTITIVNEILGAYPGSTSEAISYPACGGQSSCGGASYGSSVAQGIKAVASAVNAYHSKCPQTKLVLVGYSQVSHSH
jgi:acetylxylan esterase